MSSVLNSQTVEDWFFALTPILVALSGSNLITTLIPGVSGLVIGATIAALAKSLAGIGQQPKSLEDWLQFIITFLGILGALITGIPSLVLYGTIIGFIAKALPSLRGGINIEDLILVVGAFLSLLGGFLGNTTMVNVGIILSTIGKSLPSIVTNGVPGIISAPAPKPAPTPPTPTPTPAPGP